MQGPTAQLVAICCHFNGVARGLAVGPFFPANSTCQFCEFVHFVRHSQSHAGTDEWDLIAGTPDEWFAREARRGRFAILTHQRVNAPLISDRMSAGFVGGGGQWLLAVCENGRSDLWQPAWQVGNRQAADRRIWRVHYSLGEENAELAPPKLRSIETVSNELRRALSDALDFADEHRIEPFADDFRKAIRCLSAADPFAEVYHKDLAPDGVLDLPAKQLLAACQAAWVFGGMGSWNDMGFEGAVQERYDRLSELLFSLLNEAICVGANSTAMPSPVAEKSDHWKKA